MKASIKIFGIYLLVSLGVTIADSSAYGARLDPSFGDGGVFLHQGDSLSPAFDIAEDKAGRLVTIGWVARDGGNYLLRLRSDGTMDTSFGNRDGVAFYPDKLPEAETLAIDKQGRILTAAAPFRNQAPRGACALVTRWSANASSMPAYGSFHSTASPPGTASVCLHKNRSEFAGLQGRDISLTSSGKILVGGTYYAGDKRQGGMFTRLLPTGAIDKTLRGDKRTHTIRKGVVKLLPERNHFGSVRDIRSLPKGKVLVGGYLSGRFMAARFQADGALDRRFGRNGVVTFDLDGDPQCECSYGTAMVRDYKKRILIAGYVDPENDEIGQSLRLIRLLPNGGLDRSFGEDGVARLASDATVGVRSIAVQRDGRIVVAGSFDRKFGLARFKADGSPDESFFSDGLFTEYVFGTFGSAWDVMVDRKGRLVASGGSERGDFAVLRLLP